MILPRKRFAFVARENRYPTFPDHAPIYAMMSGVIWSSMKAMRVAQLQLALLQPLQPQQIGRGRLMQRIDRRVEIAVFLLQPRELGFEFALIFVGHGVRR